jgi:hypothetical protein
MWWYWRTTSYPRVAHLDARLACPYPCSVVLSALGKRHNAHWPALIARRIRLVFLQVNSAFHTQPTKGNPESWLQSHLLGPSLQNAPRRQPSLPFLLFIDTHFLPASSTYCLRISYFSPPIFSSKTLHHLYTCPHLRVGQEEKDASQESSQGGEAPARPPGQQPYERYRE